MSTDKEFRKPILCFGELLWDSLPQGLFPGGAPMNVAYHLHRLGRRALPVTAVGADFLGEELRRRLARWHIEAQFVGTVADKQTGVVQATLDESGAPSYQILEDVAWDWIEASNDLLQLAGAAQAIVYGTLAARAAHNLHQLTRLLERAANAFKVYDVNLRTPYDSPSLVRQLAAHADLVKLNDEELFALTKQPSAATTIECAARELATEFGCPRICVTAGERGAGLLLNDTWRWAGGRRVQVVDTVGAGDAFLARLIDGMLKQASEPHETLERACRLGGFVASCPGATPDYRITAEGNILLDSHS